jgi:hypothetical protein
LEFLSPHQGIERLSGIDFLERLGIKRLKTLTAQCPVKGVSGKGIKLLTYPTAVILTKRPL